MPTLVEEMRIAIKLIDDLRQKIKLLETENQTLKDKLSRIQFPDTTGK